MRRIVQGRPLILVAAGAAAILVIAVLLSGDDDEGGTEPASSAAATAPSAPEAPAAEAQKAGDPAAADPAPEDSTTSAPDTASESDTELTRDEIRKKLKPVPLQQRRQFAQTAVLGVLRGYGYQNATVRLAKKGAVVKVFVFPADACAQEAAKIPEIRQKLFDVILFARKVKLGVLGAGDLASYVEAKCKPLEPPTAPGKVLWSASGTGLQSSPELPVTAARFTVSFANNSGDLEIYVTKGQELIEPVIKSQTRETGSRTYAGPGTFRVTVTGSGSWAVKVFDGA